MIPVSKALSSTLGKKLIMAITGLGLVVFLILHLLGNLSLYRKDGTTFNLYAHTLEGYGLLLTIAELGLAAAFLIHIVVAFSVKKRNLESRPVGYRSWKSKGSPSLANLSSLNMIITGIVILGFLILHLIQFRFADDEGFVTEVNGVRMEDLHRVVTDTFHNPMYAGIYVASMLFVGFHLRHGFWSAFQSLGAMNPRWQRPIYGLGILLAVLLAAGFLFIPIWIYFNLGGAAA